MSKAPEFFEGLEKAPIWRRPLDAIFGYDFFISYKWTDGGAYAQALARRLEDERFTVFLDRKKYSPGEDWEKVGAWTLYNTSQLIVVGSPESPFSDPVLREIRVFSQYGRRIIPIEFDGSLVFERRDTDIARLLPVTLLRVQEPTGALLTGPTEQALIRIRDGFKSMRRSKRREIIFTCATVSFAILAAGLAWQWRLSEHALREAETNYKTALSGGSKLIDIVQKAVFSGTITTELAETFLSVSNDTVRLLIDEKQSDETAFVEQQLLSTLSLAYVNIGGLARNALDAANLMREKSEKAMIMFPGNAKIQRMRAASYLRLGDAYQATGDLDASLASYHTARSQMSDLTAQHDTEKEYKRFLGYIYQRISDVKRKLRDPDGAMSQLNESFKIFSFLCSLPDPDPDWFRGLALAHLRAGDIFRDGKVLDKALDNYLLYRRYVQMASEADKTTPPNVHWQTDLAIADMKEGDVNYARADFPTALHRYLSFRDSMLGIASRDQNQVEWRRYLANSYMKVGEARLANGDKRGALDDFRAARDIYATLIERDPRPTWKRNFALAVERVGLALRMQNRAKEAEESLSICLSLLFSDQEIDQQVPEPAALRDECLFETLKISIFSNQAEPAELFIRHSYPGTLRP